jgi:two-component sensor histidine kinase
LGEFKNIMINLKENREFNILVVEDDKGQLFLLKNILEEENYVVLTAESSKKALLLLKKKNVDLILLDIIMPAMDGFELCRLLKSQKEFKDIPIIFLTGKSEIDSVIKGFELGAADYISKPFNELELIARVRTHLALKDRSEALQIVNKVLEKKVADRTEALNKSVGKLKIYLKEKDILFQELHHRVNNIIQLISSMLNLQIYFIKDKNSHELFINSLNRVKALALIHQKLYLSKDMNNINFSEFFRSLISILYSTYKIDPNRIKLNFDFKEVKLNINIAIPLGLILNELLSNSLKYAFPHNREGIIDIKLRSKDKKKYILEFIDDGVGLSEEIDLGNVKTLGLQLISSLVNQLHGKIELENRCKGTEFKIIFQEAILSTFKDIHIH